MHRLQDESDEVERRRLQEVQAAREAERRAVVPTPSHNRCNFTNIHVVTFSDAQILAAYIDL